MIAAEPTGGMRPGIPDAAYIYALGAIVLAVCLAVCAYQAWQACRPALRAVRWWLRRRRATPGQRVDAALTRAIGRAKVPDPFDTLVAANPDLSAVDIATLADLYVTPAEEQS